MLTCPWSQQCLTFLLLLLCTAQWEHDATYVGFSFLASLNQASVSCQRSCCFHKNNARVIHRCSDRLVVRFSVVRFSVWKDSITPGNTKREAVCVSRPLSNSSSNYRGLIFQESAEGRASSCVPITLLYLVVCKMIKRQLLHKLLNMVFQPLPSTFMHFLFEFSYIFTKIPWFSVESTLSTWRLVEMHSMFKWL